MEFSVGLDSLFENDYQLRRSLDRLRGENGIARRRATELSERVERLEFQLYQARQCAAAMLHVLRSNHLLTENQLTTLIDSLNATPPEPTPFVIDDESPDAAENPSADLVHLAAMNEVTKAVEEMSTIPPVETNAGAVDELDITGRSQKNAQLRIIE